MNIVDISRHYNKSNMIQFDAYTFLAISKSRHLSFCSSAWRVTTMTIPRPQQALGLPVPKVLQHLGPKKTHIRSENKGGLETHGV